MQSNAVLSAPATRHQPSHVKVAKALGTEIVTGLIEPGTLLPGEVELSEERGVARSVVREALCILSAKGLVESRPRAGTRVSERQRWSLLDPTLLAWMFDGTPSLEFVRSLFQLRLIIEPSAAEIAAQNRTERHVSALGHALETMAEKTLETPEGQLADQRFHKILIEATGNELLVSLSASVGAAVRWTTFFKYRTALKPHDPIEDHRKLFKAILNRDGEAALEATRTLVRQAERDTLTAMGLDAD